MMSGSISVNQALDVWADLEQAMRGEHSYGGDVAEIYASRLMPHSPMHSLAVKNGKGLVCDWMIPVWVEAARSLVAIIDKFQLKYPKCVVTIDDQFPHMWLEEPGHFNHRCHVKVSSKE